MLLLNFKFSTHLNGFSQSGFINKLSINVLTFFKCGHINESALDLLYFRKTRETKNKT